MGLETPRYGQAGGRRSNWLQRTFGSKGVGPGHDEKVFGGPAGQRKPNAFLYFLNGDKTFVGEVATALRCVLVLKVDTCGPNLTEQLHSPSDA